MMVSLPLIRRTIAALILATSQLLWPAPLPTDVSIPAPSHCECIDSRHQAVRTNTTAPALAINPYVRPEFAHRLAELRPMIIAAAKRHNHPALSGMSDDEFAVVIVTILLNEHNGWFEDDIGLVRPFTPLYQDLQRRLNESTLGSNFSVWPANLRPSVALEILNNQVPVAGPEKMITAPIVVNGSQIEFGTYIDQTDLYAAITAEISQYPLAIEYLAANLERGLYRASYEQAPVSWRTLAAWHNQGIVDPEAIRANPTAADYVRRASAYLPTAQQMLAGGACIQPSDWMHS